jgi:hypothetical protein
MKFQSNRDALAMVGVIGEATQPSMSANAYSVTADGRPVTLPSVGGINPNVRVGDRAAAFAADHIEPGVSLANYEGKQSDALNVFACVGNEAVVITGDAKGEKGVVTGKHGGINHVLVDFSSDVMKRMAVGDKIQIWGCGVGLELHEASDVRVFNSDPAFLDAWGIQVANGRVNAPVTRIIPASIMGSGLGAATVVRGDYDIQMFDEEITERCGLRDIRLGDIVAIENADNSYGRIYKSGAISIGIVVHGASPIAGHGPGVTGLLTSTSGAIDLVIQPTANIADILRLR